ncbi:ATP-dependent RNA helicase DHX29 [Mytilus galloprovincialis]|nr:ATP-dependent RNA helicase DHX29 [Mytilus galloprovincialis]
MKDWILQYTENSSDESQSDEECDPNEKYLELTAKLLEAREEAVQAKLEGAKSRQKEISNNIRKLVQEMNAIEEDSRFNPAVKIKDLDKEKVNESSDQGLAASLSQSHDTPCDQGLAASLNQSHNIPSLACQQDESPGEQEESEDFGDAFTMFENQAAEEKPKEPKIDLSQLDIRQFEYTRQQWTGKSPKQFLIDWCRKHKVDSPKYHKMNPVRNLWKCRVTIGRKKEETIEACPEILCENVKEAEHLGCTLALYQLCKGQAIHQLLPPPYRDVWLEWQDSEKAKAKEAQTTENKPRDQLITKLMKKLQLGSKNSENKTTEGTKDDDDTVESWENLDEEETLLYISNSEEFSTVDGAVLIFLPGLADIQEVYELLQSDRKFSDTKRYQILALHSVLSSSDQSSAFKVPPPGVRKIVIATNIAETGITIPDVVFVIDTGKVKETRYIESSQMSSLKEVFISKANGKQRQGRAGRVREGFCFRLYTHQKYKDLADYTVPEIQRVPLEELCLHIMKCQLGEPDNFLAECLDPPRPQVIARAMSLLYEIGACKGVASLTPLGHHLAALPVHVRIGKMLLFGAIFGYVEPVAVIAAAMTTKSPFVAPLDKLDLANLAKNSMATSCSDHLTLYRAYTGWKQAQKIGYQSEQQYCQKNFLKRHTLLEIENVKNDLVKLVRSIGFSDTIQTIQQPKPKYGEVLDISKAAVAMETDLTKPMIAMVKAVITAGLYPSVAKVTYDAPVDAAANPRKVPCLGETAQGPAHVHPSSVNRHLAATGWIAYQEKVTTSKVYLRETTLVSPFSLLLFGGDIHVQHTAQLVTVDDRIKFRTYAKTGVIFRELRKLLDELLDKKLENPTLNLLGDRVIKLICRLIDCEK